MGIDLSGLEWWHYLLIIAITVIYLLFALGGKKPK